jgi:hypothetical protein
MGSAEQHTSWINTASALPIRGQPVEFMLAERECPIVGIYCGDGFRSRWTHYAAELVERWRGAVCAAISANDADNPGADLTAH